MKNITRALLLLCLICSVVISNAQEGTTTSLLEQYYGIKDALVAGNNAEASKHAADFGKALDANKSVAAALKSKLSDGAKSIADAKDIAKQRSAFAGFSSNMVSLVKSSKPSTPVYIDYCPMKEASWLSAEKEIKNPYYGDAMLTCGSVKETVKP